MRGLICTLVLALVAALAVGVVSAGPVSADPSGPAGADRRAVAASTTLDSGVYDVRVSYRGSATKYRSYWKLTVTGNRIRGTSFWTCCPGQRSDPLSGSITGDRAVVVRDCRGQGQKGPCRQTFVFTARTATRLEGTYTGTGGRGDSIVVLTQARNCTKTYAVTPSGAKLRANVVLVELTATGIGNVLERESEKYAGFDYKPVSGAPTRKQNCAGYVMRNLFGAKQMVIANVDPAVFFARIVKPYGEKRAGTGATGARDVVVYRMPDGSVKHVAIVESNRLAVDELPELRILTKDQWERVYRALFPNAPLRLTNDPLVVSYTARGKGAVEFWRLNRASVAIKEVFRGPCDLG